MPSSVHLASSHAAHWTTTRITGCTRGCGVTEAVQEACKSGVRGEVPSVVAIGPFGGRGDPSGRWALTPRHTPSSKLETADEAIEGRAAREDGVERLGVMASAESPGGGSVTTVGPPTGETAMLRWTYRLCAAAVQWGYYAGKTIIYIAYKKGINSRGYTMYFWKNREKSTPGEYLTEREVLGRAGVVPRRTRVKGCAPPQLKKKKRQSKRSQV